MDGNRPSVSILSNSQGVTISGSTFNANSTHIHTGGKDGYDKLVKIVAHNALHDSGHSFDPPKCHPGTRVAVIEAIMNWLAGADEDTRDKGVNWLTGAAGAGKSAIGRSICERCVQEGTLLTSFFFSSNDGTRNHSKSLVSTIAYQLCVNHPTIRTAVSDYIDKDPHIFTKSLLIQFVSLVINPLLTFYANEPQNVPRLIVLDGLDECVDHRSQRDILGTIRDLIKSYSVCPIRFLICSRPESNITNFLDGIQMNPMVFKISLGDEYSSEEDIEKYLRDSFQEIREGHVRKYSLPKGWPGEDNIKQLVQKSSGQFIYASTVINFTKSPDHGPHQRLAIVLGLRPPKGNDLPFVQLDALYTQIVQSTRNASLAVKILGYVALYPRISIPIIEEYLQLEDADAEDVLSDLAGIVSINRGEYEGETYCDLDLLHKSFGDFIFDQSRSQGLYYMSSADTRVSHFLRSLQIFSGRSQERYFPRELEEAIDICTEVMQAAVFDAFVQFPMESFFQDLFASHTVYCDKSSFATELIALLEKLYQKTQHHKYEDVYQRYLAIMFNCILWYLRTEDGVNNLRGNFDFVDRLIEPSHRPLESSTSVLDLMLLDLTRSVNFGYTRDVEFLDVQPLSRDGFHKICTVSERSRIVSRAVLYCLKYLCDIDRAAAVEAKIHLHLEGIHRKTRNSRPWKWHMRTSFYNIRKYEKRFVVSYNHRRREAEQRRIYFSTYEKLHKCLSIRYSASSIFSSVSFDWARHTDRVEYWKYYIHYLEYLPENFPMAGRDPDVIRLCKKAFSPMSMMFPTPSRRARQAINEYLKRMESEA